MGGGYGGLGAILRADRPSSDPYLRGYDPARSGVCRPGVRRRPAIAANVEGSEAAFEELEPEVSDENPELADDVEEGFEGVEEELDQYRKGEGFVSYEELDEAQRRALSQEVDALAEPLSRAGQALEG